MQTFRLFGPEYMNREKSRTLDQALHDAATFDLIAAKARIYPAYLASMRSVNPRLVVLAYLNGTISDAALESTYPASWFLYGADGVKVRSKYGDFVMDPRQPGWVQDRLALCRTLMAQSGYDGCMLDNLGPGLVVPPYCATCQADREPIDAQTGLPWTVGDWLRATAALAGTVRSGVSPHPLYGNGMGGGDRYFGPDGTQLLLPPTDGMLTEGFLRVGRAPLLPAPDPLTWHQGVDMLADSESRGAELIANTKVWTDGTAAQKDQWHEYSMGSFLLAANGHARWVFLYDMATDVMAGHPWWDAAQTIGTPRGASFLNAKGLYQRNFTNGRVYVNPENRTVTVTLATPYLSLDGQWVTQFTLAPQSAKVLRRA